MADSGASAHMLVRLQLKRYESALGQMQQALTKSGGPFLLGAQAMLDPRGLFGRGRRRPMRGEALVPAWLRRQPQELTCAPYKQP
eukprot:jgi/Tetstr1/434244/TSEL_023354.t1